jgi:hypothetical protein
VLAYEYVRLLARRSFMQRFRGCNGNMLTILRILLSSDGPPPGASVLDLYYENLKKCEHEKAISRKNTLADIVADVMTMGQPPPNVTLSLPSLPFLVPSPSLSTVQST